METSVSAMDAIYQRRAVRDYAPLKNRRGRHP